MKYFGHEIFAIYDIIFTYTHRYKDIIDCERITVYSFSGEKQVSSFRTTRPSATFLKLIDELNSSDSASTPSTASDVKKRKISVRKKSIHGGVEFTGGEGEGLGEDEEEGVGLIQDKRKSKQEARRLKKEQRRKEVKGGIGLVKRCGP